MIVDNLHVMRVPISKAKAHAPRTIDVDRPLALSITLERVQADALQHTDLIETTCGIEGSKPIESLLDVEPGPSASAFSNSRLVDELPLLLIAIAYSAQHTTRDVVVATVQIVRSTIIFLISAIALAGLRLLGQVLVQFMMVWQR
jgi:hypothetical protein